MKFSVIIPVYKAEKTLARCVDSLLKQGRNDVEIILINDGSPDSSGEICKEYDALYNEIKYIEKENGGVSSARNAGLDIAQGDYILFVDSDDWVSEDYFSIIDATLSNHDYDLIQFSQYSTDGEKTDKNILGSFSSFEHTELIEKLSDGMCRKYINKPNDKLYKRSIIEENSLRFHKDLSVGEDRTFNIEYALNIKSYCILEETLYYLSLENSDSLSRKKRDDLDEQVAVAENYLKAVIDKSKLTGAEKNLLISSIDFDTMRAVYTKAKYLHRNGIGLTKRLKELKKYCKDVNEKSFTYPPGKFCTLISLPVRLKLTPVIDAMGWVLTR